MKLSTALRRAAEHALDGDGWWHLSAGEAMYFSMAKFCYAYGLDSSSITIYMQPSETCLALLLLAEIAEDAEKP